MTARGLHSISLPTAYAIHHLGPAIDPANGFQQVETHHKNDRTSYPISPQSRKEILSSYLKLNHQRTAEMAIAPNTLLAKPAPLTKPQHSLAEHDLNITIEQ
jgi:hypothetical protein